MLSKFEDSKKSFRTQFFFARFNFPHTAHVKINKINFYLKNGSNETIFKVKVIILKE